VILGKRNGIRAWLALLTIAAATVLLAGGCISPPRATVHETDRTGPAARLAEAGAARKEVDQARAMIEQGDHSTIIPRLLHTISKYPRSEAAVEARYLLGLSYYEISSYRDATDMFKDYLRMAPEGEFAEPSREHIARIADEYERKYDTPEKLDEKLQEILQELSGNPEDLGKRLELADVLWRRGDYESAGKVYKAIVGARPDFAEDATVASRVEFTADGDMTLRTPREVQRREVERRPLVITNVNSFRSGRDLFTREHRHYVVSGQAVNRGESVLYGVRVHVTIYGFGNIVYDTNAVNIGRLNPGEQRAFSVRFSQFENIENIHRHEVVGSFER